MAEVKIGTRKNGYVEIAHAEPFQNSSLVTKGAYTLLMMLKNKADG